MLTSFVRTLILYLFIIVALRLMGKRQVGELEPSELVSAILISNLSAVPMQDMGIPLVQGVVPILVIFLLERMISALTAASPRAKAILSGRVSVIIKNGEIDQSELARLRINVLELMEALRQKDVFDPTSVSCAYLEPNGKLSVLLAPRERQATAKQLGIETKEEAELYMTLIAHGRILRGNLLACGHDEAWLFSLLQAHGLEKPEQVFLLIADNKGGVILLPKQGKGEKQC